MGRLCGGLCTERQMIGSRKTLSVVTTATPILATLPLLATALGISAPILRCPPGLRIAP
jgi:hypothetical protein